MFHLKSQYKLRRRNDDTYVVYFGNITAFGINVKSVDF